MCGISKDGATIKQTWEATPFVCEEVIAKSLQNHIFTVSSEDGRERKVWQSAKLNEHLILIELYATEFTTELTVASKCASSAIVAFDAIKRLYSD